MRPTGLANVLCIVSTGWVESSLCYYLPGFFVAAICSLNRAATPSSTIHNPIRPATAPSIANRIKLATARGSTFVASPPKAQPRITVRVKAIEPRIPANWRYTVDYSVRRELSFGRRLQFARPAKFAGSFASPAIGCVSVYRHQTSEGLRETDDFVGVRKGSRAGSCNGGLRAARRGPRLKMNMKRRLRFEKARDFGG